MEERREGKIHIVDVSTSVADRFLKFLYADLLPDEPAEQIQECLLLLHVANKYQVDGFQDFRGIPQWFFGQVVFWRDP